MILPARAGVILEQKLFSAQSVHFTRTSGGDPDWGWLNVPDGIFYPHERG